jgi:hypothetical protein
MIGYALLSAIVAGFWGIRALRFKQLEIAGDNLEPTLRRWLEDSGQNVKAPFDAAWDFGLLTTLPQRRVDLCRSDERASAFYHLSGQSRYISRASGNSQSDAPARISRSWRKK